MTRTISKKWTLFLTSTLTVMAGATIAPSLPQMASVFANVPNAQLLSKLVLTVPALTIAISSPFTGKLIDNFGRLRILYICLILYTLGGASGYILDNLYLILVGRALLGISVGGIMTIVVTLVGDYYNKSEQSTFLGQQSAFMGLGGVVFLSLGGLLADISWRYPFLIYTFSLAILLLAIVFLREPEITEKNFSEIQGFNKIPQLIWGILVSGFFGMLFFYIVPVQLPFLLKSYGIESNAMAGYAIATCTLASTVTSLGYKWTRNQFTNETIMTIIFWCLGIGLLIAGLTGSYVIVLLGMVTVGLGVGLLMPNINSWLLENVKESHRGYFTGLLTSSIFIGQFISPIVIAPFSKYLTMDLLFLFAGGISCCVGGVYLCVLNIKIKLIE